MYRPGALALLDRAHTRGTALNAKACSIAINACSAGDQWQWSLSLLRRMQARGPRPDTGAYNSAIAACKESYSRVSGVCSRKCANAKFEWIRDAFRLTLE